MQIISSLRKIKEIKRPVLALGVFDGLHKGHQNILKAVLKKSGQIKGTSVVVTFWPHPQKESSLYSLEHRLRLLDSLKIDVCIIINFNLKFSQMSAEGFIKDILGRRLKPEFVYVGENFRFGYKAKGDYRLLARMSKIYNFKLKKFSIIRINKQPVSSTAIRKLVRQGNLSEGEKLLGRPVSIFGSVIKGSGFGRKLGFPTANINPHHEVIPPQGIYAARIILSGKKYGGVCYIGKKPTVSKRKNISIEAHILDFHKNIYGKYIEIQFIKLIRSDKKFESVKSLACQIRQDLEICRKILSSRQ